MPTPGDDPFRRLVQKAVPRQTTVTKHAPPSAYTLDVIARGSQAVKDRAAGASFDRTQAPQALDWAQQTGLTADPTQQYVDWASQRFAGAGQQPVTFGQSAKGAYSGFKTEGELKAALGGRAQQYRQEDQQHAAQQYGSASDDLNGLLSQFDTQQDRTRAALAPAALSGAGIGLGHVTGHAPTTWGGPDVLTAEGPTASDTRHRQNDLDYANQLGAYNDRTKQWLADASQDPLQQMDTARQIESTPVSQYAGLAGADYGIDPTLVAGWFPQSADVTDFNTQRNLQSINDYGMPYSDVTSYRNQGDQAAAADQRQAATDQTAAAKQAADDQQAQIAQVVGDATGQDVTQLAQATNMTPVQVAQVVADPSYQQASSDLQSVLFDPAFDPSNQQDADAVNAVLDQPAIRQDPQLYAMLLQVYGNYLG